MIKRAQKKRVVVAMSGGVDSSVAAYLLQKEGYDVIGVTIKTWSNSECRDEKSKGCCSIRDINDARTVARKLDIPYYVMDLSTDFKGKVIDYFVDEYLVGRTPNPCIECNSQIKFGVLRTKAIELDADYVATGHYAQKEYDPKLQKFFIKEGEDASKDQSYVLFGLSQEQLAMTLFPVGAMQKSQIRKIAEELDLRIFDKPDSQEICFVKKSYVDFVKEHSPDELPGSGEILDQREKVIGKHSGHHLYTVGQRRRIGVTHPEPLFVTKIDAKTNRIYVGAESDLLLDKMTVRRLHWFSKPKNGESARVKIRYKHTKTDLEFLKVGDATTEVAFKAPQKAITPGQAAVFYQGNRVIGGGWIQ